MNVAFYTLGCKANQFETQALEKMFTEKGHCVVPFASKADAYIINTCTVTASGDKKSRNAAYRARTLNPDCILVVCGCYAPVSYTHLMTSLVRTFFHVKREVMSVLIIMTTKRKLVPHLG